MRCKYAIVGAGVAGLSTALHLAIMSGGGDDICVFEKDFVGYGNSGRNIGRFRVHFGAEANFRFALRAIDYLRRIGRLIDLNPLIIQSGYLWLIADEESYKTMKKHLDMFERAGVPLKEFTPEETYKKYPYLRPRRELIASFLGPQDGAFHPDAIMYGLERACKRRGVKIFEKTFVSDVVIKDGRVIGLETLPGGFVESSVVVLAPGEYLKYFSDKLGLEIPLNPVRKEATVTEPFRYRIEPLIIDSVLHIDFSQTLKGEIIGGRRIEGEAEGIVPRENTIKWVREYAKALRIVLRGAENIRIMRLWSGFYEMTPDRSHVIGRSRDWPEGLYVIGGFSGHGFMFGPYAGRVLAEHILTGRVPEISEPFTPDRFKSGKLIHETFVVG